MPYARETHSRIHRLAGVFRLPASSPQAITFVEPLLFLYLIATSYLDLCGLSILTPDGFYDALSLFPYLYMHWKLFIILPPMTNLPSVET